MLFFNKKPKQPKGYTPEQPKGYTPEQNALRNQFAAFINLDAFESKILSIERNKLGEDDEETVVYVMNGVNTDDYGFNISREQHEQLVKDFLALKKNQDAAPL